MWRNILKSKTKYDHIVQKTPPHNLIINHLYSPTIIVAGIAIGTPIAAQISFGLSIGAIAASPSAMISATCTQDWIEVNTNFLLFNQRTMDTQWRNKYKMFGLNVADKYAFAILSIGQK